MTETIDSASIASVKRFVNRSGIHFTRFPAMVIRKAPASGSATKIGIRFTASISL